MDIIILYIPKRFIDMDLKVTINKLHSDLSSKFSSVSIFERSSTKMGQYFEIVISESRVVRAIFPYKNFNTSGQINWMYFSNPEINESTLVERSGTVDQIPFQVEDILSNNRFSKEYINS